MNFIIITFLVAFSAANASELPCNCRLGNLNRIVNGEIAAANSIPWMVSLSDTGSDHFCGGTILNENFILTAAHCTDGKTSSEILVRANIHETKFIDINNLRFVKRIIQGDFKEPGDLGDFALLELRHPLVFETGKVEPACVNFENKNFEGDLLSAGWGLIERPWKKFGEELNSIYQPNAVLKYYFSTQNLGCSSHEICILPKNEGDSVCNGDSGGPLMYTENGKTSVVGMASYVSGKFEDGKMFFCNGDTTYARLALYKNLIDEHVVNYCSA